MHISFILATYSDCEETKIILSSVQLSNTEIGSENDPVLKKISELANLGLQR